MAKLNKMKSIGVIAIVLAAFIGIVTSNTPRTCYSCSGINCMRTSLNTTKSCANLLDYCVTIFENFNVVHKGCSIEVPSEWRRRCDMNTVECHKCNMNRCNDMGQANFECIQCDSSKDSNCASNPQSIMPTRCAVPTAPNSYCYVQYEGSMTKRGCATAVSEQRNCWNDANCMLCMPGDIRGCNAVDFMRGSRAKRL